MTNNLFDLLDPTHLAWEYLTDDDVAEAHLQLSRGETDENVKRRLIDWAAQYRLEQGAFDDETERLHADQ